MANDSPIRDWSVGPHCGFHKSLWVLPPPGAVSQWLILSLCWWLVTVSPGSIIQSWEAASVCAWPAERGLGRPWSWPSF